jgi:hypothetical protein
MAGMAPATGRPRPGRVRRRRARTRGRSAYFVCCELRRGAGRQRGGPAGFLPGAGAGPVAPAGDAAAICGYAG